MNRFGPNSLSDGDGWFRVGTVQVTTTIAAVAMAIISLFFAAASPSFFSEGFWLSWETLRRFQLWRIVTWPLVNSISIWTILSIAVLFLFGREIEARIGKHRFAWMLAAMTLVGGVASAVVFSAYDAPTFVAGIPMGDPVAATAIAGVAELVQGLFLAFVLINPRARSFFGIPLWLFVAVFQLLDILSAVATRNWPQLANILAIDAVVALLVRAFGVTEFEQIPKIPLPSFVTGDPYQKANRAREKAQRAKHKSQGADVIAMPNTPRRTLEPLDQAYMDVLLDKIGEGGLDSLTRDERAKLDEYSRRLRDN